MHMFNVLSEWNEAVLIYGADKKVLRQSPQELFPETETLFQAEFNVTGESVLHYIDLL